MTPEEMGNVEEVLAEVRRLHSTGGVDVIAVVALGPDPEHNLIFLSNDVERPGDAVRLLGTVASLQAMLSSAAIEGRSPVPEPGPRGVVPDG